MKNKIIFFLILLLLGVCTFALFPRSKPTFSRLERDVKEIEFPGKDVFVSFTDWLGRKERPFYISAEFHKLIQQPVVKLDKPVYLEMGIFVEKPVLIEGASPETRSKIFIYRNTVALSIFADDIKFRNIDFYLSEVDFFAQAREEKLKRRPKGLSFENCRFFLYQGSSLSMNVDGLVIEKSLIRSEKRRFQLESSMLWLSGKNMVLENNLIFNLEPAIRYPVFLEKVEDSVIRNNAFISYQEEVSGLITISLSKNLLIEGNYLEDLNLSQKFLALGKERADDEEIETNLKFLDGGVAFWLTSNEGLELKNNLFGTTNEEFDQISNEKKLSSKVWHSQLETDLSAQCGENEEFLSKNSFIQCKK